MNIKIKQELNSATAATLAHATHALLLLPEGDLLHLLNVPHAEVFTRQFARLRSAEGAQLLCDLPNARSTQVSAARVKSTASTFELLTLARKLVAPLLEQRAVHITLACPGLDAALAERGLRALCAALLAGIHMMPDYKSKKTPPHPLRTLTLLHTQKLDLDRICAQAQGNNLARTLTCLPPNDLTPALYRKRVAQLAKHHGWAMTFWDEAMLKRKGAGAFLAVAQGSPERDAGIVHLRYVAKKRKRGLRRMTQPALALVGKGICFDTGGMNLKPARSMHGMHEDMAGSAVALGTLLALTELNVGFTVDCWLALAQNHIGPHAYKQNDVVRAANGVSIEITHTDAEGRMVLADTLHFASQQKPGLLIDYATLTGSCIQALGTNYSGILCNDEALTAAAIGAGRDSGERVWPFPLDSDYDTLLDSKIADIKQCTLDNDADHILAARFLSRFVASGTRWLHVDLSAINHKGGLAHIPTDVTGFGVGFTLELLLGNKALGALPT